MKRVLPIILVIVMFGWAIVEFVNSTRDQAEDALSSDSARETEEIGLKRDYIAPDFEIMTLDGQQVRLSDYRGERIMLNFWATWCPPCRAEMPDMERFYQDTEIEVLAVNLLEAERTIDDVDQFVDEYELTFPILLDEIIEVAMIYEIQPIPTTFMIDSEGTIQFKSIGPLTYDQMIEVLDNIN
ncbi:MAG TPA: redoxin domain-containing protein [Bacilli bacterium]|nr:redoxin domain-containing protein [Bacilli bacterium]